MSLNLSRRHMTTGQKAMVAAKAMPLYKDEANKRQLATLKRGASNPNLPVPPISAERGIPDLAAKAKKNSEGEVLHQAGKAAGVGKTTVKAAIAGSGGARPSDLKARIASPMSRTYVRDILQLWRSA